MSNMDRRTADALGNHITGHCGEDALPPCEECGQIVCRCAGHVPPTGLAFALPPRADPAELLRQSADLFEERNKQYASQYHRFGETLLLLFPDRTIPKMTMPGDATRLNLMMMCLAKLQRYGHQWDNPSPDHCRDLQVYAAMLEEVTAKEVAKS